MLEVFFMQIPTQNPHWNPCENHTESTYLYFQKGYSMDFSDMDSTSGSLDMH